VKKFYFRKIRKKKRLRRPSGASDFQTERSKNQRSFLKKWEKKRGPVVHTDGGGRKTAGGFTAMVKVYGGPKKGNKQTVKNQQ